MFSTSSLSAEQAARYYEGLRLSRSYSKTCFPHANKILQCALVDQIGLAPRRTANLNATVWMPAILYMYITLTVAWHISEATRKRVFLQYSHLSLHSVSHCCPSRALSATYSITGNRDLPRWPTWSYPELSERTCSLLSHAGGGITVLYPNVFLSEITFQ
jgi:hypothetical protein